ncbi:geranylgeranyl reductase family protein [Hymenobacter sp. RP-2-7]|uniref:Geranylgeranyl reductase family protein n=1 Tax=Hymenobacter polaris TaxID=2682546 RepID=A0A7Y0AAQ2_9BACT|nr:geranylgeranyl reductase family protein [Hymenobacter polaris]NML63895.1 geranylgeranyl reductase family protein [Hymenobacter polaris]
MDICILGAGPGGAIAALHLAKAGHRCLLLDRAAFPRDKICGDALSGKVLSELRHLGGPLTERLAEAGRGAASWGITFAAPSGQLLRVPFKKAADIAHARPDGYVLPRLTFDNLLVEEVRRQPLIELRENCEVARTERGGLGWRLLDKQGGLLAECRLLLVANGAQSSFVRQVVGRELEPAAHCAGVRAYYRGVAGLDPQHFVELHFLPELLPGYLWIFPLADGGANVGLGMLSQDVAKKRLNLRQRLEELVATHPSLQARFAQAERLGPVRGWGLPLGSRRRPLSGEGYLLLGDAASLIDPFSGEGISHAMVSGRHAADWAGRALATSNVSAGFLAGYDAAVYRRLGQELRLSTAMQRLLRWPQLFNFIANRAVANPTLAETLSAMFLDIDLRARLKQPGFYLRLLFGRGK